MHIDAATLSAILLAVIGGGGAVPFFYRSWVKRHPRPIESEKTKAEIEAISQHAATETINAMKGAMMALSEQLTNGKVENEALRRELESNRAKITELERKVERLVAEVVRLGGRPDDEPLPATA